MMRWFRANARFGGKLALFALALQFALSFGHVHPEDIYGARATVSAAAHAAAVAKAEKPRPGDPSSKDPSSKDPSSKHSDDYCAICATMSLLGNSFVAAPPLLPAPQVFSRAVEHVDNIAILVIAPRRAPFQSRAPPTA
jgi:hypothetical protein